MPKRNLKATDRKNKNVRRDALRKKLEAVTGRKVDEPSRKPVLVSMRALKESQLVTDARAPDWFRIGGHRFQFFALEQEVQQWLATDLPSHDGPYTIIVVGQLKEHPVSDLYKLYRAGRSQFFLRSKALTPDINITRRPFISSYENSLDIQLGFSGLILLQFSQLGPHSISLVDKVLHSPTDRIFLHDEYLPLYSSLKRIFRKRLVYKVKQWNRMGSRADWKQSMMTELMADLVEKGKFEGILRFAELKRATRPP
jgi:hypothetical protein